MAQSRPPVKPKPAARRTSPARREEENLSFQFGDEDDEWKAESPPDRIIPEEPFSFSSSTTHNEHNVLDLRATEPSPDETETASGTAESRTPARRASLRPVFVFLFLVVTGYAVVAGALYANPDFTDGLVREVPLVGATSGGVASRNILLTDVEGGYERTKAGKDIFVVTGYAVNQADLSLSSIQVRVQLIDAVGNVIQDRVVFCGSTVPRKLLRDLTVNEVSVLGRLKPPRTFLIHPGERSPFMAVFADAPPAVTEAITQVAAAQRHP